MRLDMKREMIRKFVIVGMLALLVAGCGRKEPPQVLAKGAPPQIVELTHEVNGPALALNFRLLGSARGVGYQIDRAEMDPYCKCPTMWRRHFEQPAMAKQVDTPIRKLINLGSYNREFLFRIRAVDVDGNLGEWSQTIHAQAVDLLQK
ncbi:MAG TPA: hypothetical protein VNI58_06180 [Mariprofundaceae bacterium]|nr:hypothetical protein [Mariprofundaceae bacterium]